MSLIFSPQQLERRAPALVGIALLGLLGFGFMAVFRAPHGILSCFAAVFLGATWGCVERYRTERGVWLIAGLIVLFGGAMWAFFVLGDLVPRFRGTIPLPWGVALDAAVCTAIWGASVRVAGSAAVHNLRLVRPRTPRPTPWT